MKRVIPFCLLLATFSMASAQNCFDKCDETNTYPADFKGQFCWLLNELCYNFSFPRWESAKKATNDDVQSYLKYTAGVNSFYCNQGDIPWGSNWFACKNGGIARRWKASSNYSQSGNYPAPNRLLNWDDVRKMSSDQINGLSPAEKLDIFVGNTDFRITKWELTHRGPYRGTREDDNYCGFCNGARSSGALMFEPLVSRTVNAGAGAKLFDRNAVGFSDPNIQVTFYPADIKALAAASFYYNERAYNVGRNNGIDPNPAVLDFMLRFLLSKLKTPFFLDVMPNSEIWNETIVGYDRKLGPVREISPSEASQLQNQAIKKAVPISLALYCQDEVAPLQEINKQTTEVMGNMKMATEKGWVKRRKYAYTLFVDGNDKIVDGKWVVTPGWEGRVYNEVDLTPIDFIWMATGGGADDKNGGNININYGLIKYLFTGSDLIAQDDIEDPNASRRQMNPHSVEIPQPMITPKNLQKISKTVNR